MCMDKYIWAFSDKVHCDPLFHKLCEAVYVTRSKWDRRTGDVKAAERVGWKSLKSFWTVREWKISGIMHLDVLGWKGKILWAVVKYERFLDLLEHQTKQKSMEAFKKVIAQKLQTVMLDCFHLFFQTVFPSIAFCDWTVTELPPLFPHAHTHTAFSSS